VPGEKKRKRKERVFVVGVKKQCLCSTGGEKVVRLEEGGKKGDFPIDVQKEWNLLEREKKEKGSL